MDHAWNTVKINGQWYETDLTWTRGTISLLHSVMGKCGDLVSDGQMQIYHAAGRSYSDTAPTDYLSFVNTYCTKNY